MEYGASRQIETRLQIEYHSASFRRGKPTHTHTHTHRCGKCGPNVRGSFPRNPLRVAAAAIGVECKRGEAVLLPIREGTRSQPRADQNVMLDWILQGVSSFIAVGSDHDGFLTSFTDSHQVIGVQRVAKVFSLRV